MKVRLPYRVGAIFGVAMFAGLTLFTVVAGGTAAHPAVAASTYCYAAADSQQPAYDPVNDLTYVPSNLTGYPNVVTALNMTSCSSQTISLPAGAGASAATFDSKDGHVYVSDYLLDQVYVINGTRIVATVGGGWFDHPVAVAYDPLAGSVLVANFASGNLTEITGTRVVGSFSSGGSGPASIAVDTAARSILVVNQQSRNLTIVTDAASPLNSPQLSDSYSAPGQLPLAVAFDKSSGLDYVSWIATNGSGWTNGSLSLVYGKNGTLAGTVFLGLHRIPSWLGYSPATSRVYVALTARHTVWELSGTTVVKETQLAPRSVPVGFAYDSAAHRELVCGFGTPSSRIYAIV